MEKFKKILPAVLLSLAGSFIICCTALTVIPAKGERVLDTDDEIVRFRVVANSDSEEDQALKLRVRDGLLPDIVKMFSECESTEDVRSAFYQGRETIKLVAEDIISGEGKNSKVNIRLVTEEVPLQRYENMVIPSGEYLTLRVDIGEARGKNWWCVMYPSAYLESALGSDGSEVITNTTSYEEPKSKKKKVKFALWELLF